MPSCVTINSSVSSDSDNAVSVVYSLILFHAVVSALVTLKSASVVVVVDVVEVLEVEVVLVLVEDVLVELVELVEVELVDVVVLVVVRLFVANRSVNSSSGLPTVLSALVPP